MVRHRSVLDNTADQNSSRTTTKAPESFQYESLGGPGSHTIRLLLPVPEAGLLHLRPPIFHQFRLHHAILSPELKFKALSYTWGPAHETRQILLNNCLFTIRMNLYNFLLRPETRTEIPLWIDAICINQDDIDERNRQVAMMGEIYAQAKKVFIWLGNLGVNPRSIQNTFPVLNRQPTNRIHDTSVWDHQREWWKRLSLGRRAEIYEVAKKMHKAEYWTRAWVIQEIWLGKHVDILCDAQVSVAPQWLTNLERLINNAEHQRQSETERSRRAGAMDTDKRYLFYLQGVIRPTLDSMGNLNIQRWTLESLIEAAGGSQCSVAHDRIYALLGLVDSCIEFPVDYRESLPRLLLRVLCFCNRNNSRLAALWRMLAFGKTLMQLLDVTANGLKILLLQDQSAAEELDQVLNIHLKYRGSIVAHPDDLLSNNKLHCNKALLRRYTGRHCDIETCRCHACFNGKGLRIGDLVYSIEHRSALLIYRECEGLDGEGSELVAIGNDEKKSITIFIENDFFLGASTGWRSISRGKCNLILQLPIKDFFWALGNIDLGINSASKDCRWAHEPTRHGLWPRRGLHNISVIPLAL